ncbi:hypothetical protein KBD08_00520 [Candidatus Babeliales bacterium]|nr:hypothetical protein [Candidatus Babeliales bacterium]
MKHTQLLYISSIAVIITCWNGSMVNTTSDKKRPDVNFCGTIEDYNHTFNAEDILIGDKYEKVPFYLPTPTTKAATAKSTTDINPAQNQVLLDLQEIRTIEAKHTTDPVEHQLTINNKKYVAVEVTSITGTKNEYLVESYRKISCLHIDKGPDNDQKPIEQERKLDFIALKNLTIKNYKSATDVKKSQSHDYNESEKAQAASATEKILDQIEEKVNNLPKEDPSNYEKIKESLLTLLKSLRDQLQKVLNMIKG